MGSEKIFMFGEPSTGGRADLTAILPALMNNNKGIDPSILAMLGNRDGNGRDGFGNDFFAILLLFILMGWGGNNNGGFFGNRGNGGGEGLNILNNDSTRELLMSAIQGNGNAISQLSTQLGCTTGQIQDGINTLNMSSCQLGYPRWHERSTGYQRYPSRELHACKPDCLMLLRCSYRYRASRLREPASDREPDEHVAEHDEPKLHRFEQCRA